MNLPITASHERGNSETYRLLVNSITDYAIFMLDRNGLVASWNAGAKRFKGYEASEILGEHFSRFYTEEDRKAGLPEMTLRTVVEQGRFEDEGWRVRKDGTRFWAHVVIDPIRDNEGAITGYAKITRDLTDRRNARAALRNSEEQFRRLVQGVTDYAIYMLDPAGNVESWNAGAERIKGYLPHEIIGTHFSRFYTEEDRLAGIPDQGLAAAARDGHWEQEGTRVRKDGSHFQAHVIIDAIHDETGELVGFAKVTRDVTERKRTQQALEQAQQALFQSQKMESLGQLTGGVAHDFNNLLSVIMNSLELLRNRLPEDARAQALLDNAMHGAERGARLIRHMLAFARRQELKVEAVSLQRLIPGLVEIIDRSVGPGINVEVHIPQALPPVRTDPNQLETAILNLALNARDAMPEGGRIVISARMHTGTASTPLDLRPGHYVVISVSDTGTGMDEVALMRAPEPFFTTKGAGKGTGLGLSMVQGLAEQSGGKLQITSQLGYGTTVSVWLAVAEAGLAAAAQGPSESVPAVAAEQESLLILVVDDDPLVRLSVVALLEELGHSVVSAESGNEALQIIASNPAIELILSDELMPGMTGSQLTTIIHELRPNLPVILASGFAELRPGSAVTAPRLAKPFSSRDLVAAIAAAMAAARG